MVKLVDTGDLKSPDCNDRAGSIPVARTTLEIAMKVARVSNFDKNDYDEAFVTIEGRDTFPLEIANPIAELLNNMNHMQSPDYCRVVPDDYVLQKFEV